MIQKYRAFLLKQRYSDLRKQIPESNYQTICLDLIKESDDTCGGNTYLRSVQKIPSLIQIGNPMVYPQDYFSGDITFVSRERMRYTGYNRFLKNIIYASLNTDGHLYLKSENPQFVYMEKISMTGIFENPEETDSMSCDNNDSSCDVLDRVFPLEESLINPLIELCVKELGNSIYKPLDSDNNASDDLAKLATFLRQNVKSPLQKQIEG